jgi:hypothetical protein
MVQTWDDSKEGHDWDHEEKKVDHGVEEDKNIWRLNSSFPKRFNEDEITKEGKISTVKYDRYMIDRGQVYSVKNVGTTVPVTFHMVGDQKAEVLWDSGASVTIMSLAFLRTLIKKGVHIRMSKSKYVPTLTVANNETMKPTGFATITMVLDNTNTLTLGCWVLNGTPHDLIVGSDTFRRTKAWLSYSRNRITMRTNEGKSSVPFDIRINDFGMGPVTAVLGQEVTILPGREHLVEVAILGDRKKGTDTTLFGGAIPEYPRLRVANSFSPIDNDSAVAMISNMGDTPISLYPGESIGRVDFLNETGIKW